MSETKITCEDFVDYEDTLTAEELYGSDTADDLERAALDDSHPYGDDVEISHSEDEWRNEY